MYSFNASVSGRVSGYTLQFSAVGASFFRSIAWSQGLLGGNRFDSSSLNTFANCLYWVGRVVVVVFPSSAAMAMSVEAPLAVVSFSNSCTIACFLASRAAIIVFLFLVTGLIDRSTIGSIPSSIVACLQLNLGSYVLSHG